MTSDFQLECNEEPEQEIPMTRKVKHKEDAQKSMPPLYFFLSIFSWKASLKKKLQVDTTQLKYLKPLIFK